MNNWSYDYSVKHSYDRAKNAQNLAKHGVAFESITHFEWSVVITKPDNRFDYGEQRFISYAPVKGRLHCLVWTIRDGLVRPISFRKANARERKEYEKETESA